jgi:large subunit ribosomal protein L10Ae
MSKIDRDMLTECVAKILAFAKGETIQVGDESKKGKVRGFLETIELQTTIKNFDPTKEKRFSGNIVLPHAPRPNLRLCVIGNEAHYTAAKDLGLAAMNVEDLKKFNKNKKLVKRMAKKYHGFLASYNLIKQIPRYLGPTLQRVKKFPTMLSKTDDVENKVNSLKKTVAIKMKKVLCISFGVANVGMAEDEIVDNILKTVNFLVSLPKKHWQNIKCLYIKSTMGPSFCIYA